MNTEKGNKLYSNIFKMLYYIFCGLFGATFLCFAALVIIVRLSDYHGKSFEEMLTLARYRISSADMASLVTDMTIGYIPNRESVEENSNEIIKKLNDNWDDVLYYYGNVKNTDFAVIVAGTDRLSELNLNDESLYLYKSPDYESYDSHLCGRVFGTIFYPSYYPAEVILDSQTGFYQRDTESDYLEDALYIHVLYSPVSNPVESDADHFDSLFTDKNILSLIDFFNTADTVGIPVMIVSLICGIICFVLITMTAGHVKSKEEITLSFFDRVPLEIVTLLLAGAEILLISCSIEILENLTWSLWEILTPSDMLGIGFIMSFLLIIMPLLLYGTVVARIKAKSLFKNTIIGKIVSSIWRTTGKISNWILTHFSVAKRLIICIPIICIISILEAAVIQDSSDFLAFLFIVARLFEIALILYLVYGYSKLREGAARIADGNLEEPVSLKNLTPEYKLFANDLNSTGESIKFAVDERMKSERMKTQLITNVSHDIKTPLTSIINYVDLMQKDNTSDEEKNEYLGILAKQSERLKKLIQDLIDASKASSGAVEVNNEPIDITTLSRQIAGEYQDKFEKNELVLVSKGQDEPINVNADSNLLWRVMDNLFGNTLKYAMPGTRVYTEVYKEDNGKVCFSICNISKDPLGISEDELMERFVRGDASRNTEGSGLGLSIAKSLMELMNGNLSLKIDGDMFKAVLELKEVIEPEETTEVEKISE